MKSFGHPTIKSWGIKGKSVDLKNKTVVKGNLTLDINHYHVEVENNEIWFKVFGKWSNLKYL